MGGGDQESSTTFQLSPEQREMLNLAMPFLRDVGNNPPPPPSGTAIAPFNKTQQFAQKGALGTVPALNDFAANAWDSSHYLTNNVVGSTPFTTQHTKLATGEFGGANPTFQATRDIASGDTKNPVLDIFDWLRDKAGVEGAKGFLSGEQNPAFDSAVTAATRPIVEATLQQALPAVRQDFIGAGQYGGTKQGLAEGNAINTMQRNIGDVSSQMANDLYSTNLDALLQGMGLYSDAYSGGIDDRLAAAGLADSAYGRTMDSMLGASGQRVDAHSNELETMLRSLGLAPQTASLGLLPWQVAAGVGDTRHGMEMAKQQEAYNQDNLARMWNLTLGQELAGTAGGIPGGTNISSQDAPSLNPFSAILGGLSLVGGLGPLFGFI